MAKPRPTIEIGGVDISSIKLDPRVDRVLCAANDIAESPCDNIGFIHSTMCQTCLPAGRRPGHERSWEQSNGHTAMRVEAGSVYDSLTPRWLDQPLPYGAKSRLALIHMNTLAIQNRSPQIDLERTMTSFIRRIIGRAPNGKDIEDFKEQIASLCCATIRFTKRDEQTNTQIISRFDLLWRKPVVHLQVWPKQISLSDEYWSSLRTSAVPVDMRAISALGHSALAIDIYAWLAHRLWRVKDPYLVYWTTLHRQFGRGYGRLDRFKARFREALRSASAVYPRAIIEECLSERERSRGILLYPSPPPVPRKG